VDNERTPNTCALMGTRQVATRHQGAATELNSNSTVSEPGPSELRQEAPVDQGPQTILFVDDEPNQRFLGQAILENSGYKVMVARDGLEAVEVFRRERNRIALVILDLIMPRLSGQDTFRSLRQLSDKVPVMFASGSKPEQLSAEENQHVAGYVAKPYRPRELAAAVRNTLDRQAAQAVCL
jgi:DNA-binding response OmpR family regulator